MHQQRSACSAACSGLPCSSTFLDPRASGTAGNVDADIGVGNTDDEEGEDKDLANICTVTDVGSGTSSPATGLLGLGLAGALLFRSRRR